MATEEIGVRTSAYIAAADYSTKQFYAMIASTAADRTAVLDASGNKLIIGVLQNKPASGAVCDIMVSGNSKAILGGSVTRGDKLKTDSNGKFVTASSSGNLAVGEALESGSDGEIRTIRLFGTASTVP